MAELTATTADQARVTRVREVLDDDAHVVHPLDCHALDGRHATRARR